MNSAQLRFSRHYPMTYCRHKHNNREHDTNYLMVCLLRTPKVKSSNIDASAVRKSCTHSSKRSFIFTTFHRTAIYTLCLRKKPFVLSRRQNGERVNDNFATISSRAYGTASITHIYPSLHSSVLFAAEYFCFCGCALFSFGLVTY